MREPDLPAGAAVAPAATGKRVRPWALVLLALWVVPVAALPRLAPHARLVVACALLGHAAWLVVGLLGGLRGRPGGRRLEAALWTIALAGRAALLVGPEEGLSDDVYRYVWEGRVWTAGEDPYLRAPSDPALDRLGDPALRARVNHPDVPAAYPPATEALCALSAALGLGARGFRVAVVLLELLGWAALRRALARRALPPLRAAWFACMPLAVLEASTGAHVDAVAAALLAAGALSSLRGRPLGTGALVALGALVKPPSLVALPFLSAKGAGRRVAAGAALVLLPAAGFYLSRPARLLGLGVFARRWEHNAPLMPGLRRVLEAAKQAVGRWMEGHGVPHAVRSLVYDVDPNLAARAVLLVGFSVLLVALWRRRGDPFARASWAFLGFFLAQSTVHPWYLLALAPLLALSRRPPPAGLMWCGTVLLAYLALPAFVRDGVWREPWVAEAVEYGVPLAAVAVIALRSRVTGSGAG